MIAPVKKQEGEYFVSIDYHLQELHKLEENLEAQKKLVKYYKEEIKRVEKENGEIKEQLKKFLNQLGGKND